MSAAKPAIAYRLITLHEAVRVVKTHTGRRVSYSSLFRWTRQGSRGHQLESRLIQSRVYTTEEAIMDFLSTLEQDRAKAARRLHEGNSPACRARRRTKQAKARAVKRARRTFRKGA